MRRLVLTPAPALVLPACAESAQDADTTVAAGMESAAGLTVDTAGASRGTAMTNPNSATREQLARLGKYVE